MVCIPGLWPFVPGPEVSAPRIGKNGKGLFLNDGKHIQAPPNIASQNETGSDDHNQMTEKIKT